MVLKKTKKVSLDLSTIAELFLMACVLNSQMTYQAGFILLSIFLMKPSHLLIEMDPRKNTSTGMGT